jgi:hypothetical protein
VLGVSGKKVIKFGQLGVLYRPVAPRASKQAKPLGEEDQRLVDEMQAQQNERENVWLREAAGGGIDE